MALFVYWSVVTLTRFRVGISWSKGKHLPNDSSHCLRLGARSYPKKKNFKKSPIEGGPSQQLLVEL